MAEPDAHIQIELANARTRAADAEIELEKQRQRTAQELRAVQVLQLEVAREQRRRLEAEIEQLNVPPSQPDAARAADQKKPTSVDLVNKFIEEAMSDVAPAPVTPREKMSLLAFAREAVIAVFRLGGLVLLLLAFVFHVRGFGGPYMTIACFAAGFVLTAMWAGGLCAFVALSAVPVYYRATMSWGVALLLAMCVLVVLDWRDLPPREAARRVLDVATLSYTVMKNEVRDVAKDLGLDLFLFELNQRCFILAFVLIFQQFRRGKGWIKGRAPPEANAEA